MLRVLHVVDSLQIGGTEWQCLSLITGLRVPWCRNFLMCLNREGSLLEALRRTRVTSLVLPFSGFHRPAAIKSLLQMVVFMRRERIQIVQAYGFYSNVPALLAGRMAGVPILLASRRDMGEFLSRVHRLTEKGIFRFATRVVVNAAAIRRELLAARQVREDKIVVIPTGVDPSRFDRNISAGDQSVRPVWAGTGKIVAMVARFRRQKDQPTFLRAAKQILSVDPTVVFVLAGDGYLKESTEQFARDLRISQSVWFVGAVAPDEMPAFLRQVDISVLASRSNEGIPNVVLEAMAAGKPVVATDTGGCSEAVVDGVTGFLVPPGDAEELAKRVLRLLRDDSEATLMGKAGRARVEAEFTLLRMVDRFSSLYEDLAHRKLRRAVEV